MAVVVGPKGQVVIEKRIRDALGIRPGDTAVETLDGEQVVIRFFPAQHSSSLRGILEQAASYRVGQEQWEDARGHAWRTAARQALEDVDAQSDSVAGPHES
jgi:AbrB family looped-hinge helix DNA binding protein